MPESAASPDRGAGLAPHADPEFAPSPEKKDAGGHALATASRRLSGTAEFSIGMGIVAPVACLALQPALIPGIPLPGLSFLNTHWLFCYGVIGLEFVTLAIWLALGTSLGRWSGIVAGSLLAGGLFAGVLGLVLLPFSLIGLFAMIGILGFVPLFTSFVYFYHGVSAYRGGQAHLGGPALRATALLGAVLVLGLPGAVQAKVSAGVRAVIDGVEQGDRSAMATLRRWHLFVNSDAVAWAYDNEVDPVCRARLAEAYQELTGEGIEARLSRLKD